jgi:hypothetical protein
MKVIKMIRTIKIDRDYATKEIVHKINHNEKTFNICLTKNETKFLYNWLKAISTPNEKTNETIKNIRIELEFVLTK